jgi:3-isopropylmalate/(R)-2-methylmalate dehydratase small subunit
MECHNSRSRTEDGDILEADLENGTIYNITKSEDYNATKLPTFLLNVLKAGGAVEAYREAHYIAK